MTSSSRMATAAMAGAAGAAVVLYYTGWGSMMGFWSKDVEGADEKDSDYEKLKDFRKRVVIHRPARPPSTWFESLSTLSETLRFTYSETLGKWPIGDLAFGINYLLRRQGHLHVAGVFAGEDSKRLSGPEVVAELNELKRLVSICFSFSKKPFPLFLESNGFISDNVLIQEGKAGILKPAFTILVDDSSQCILLVIRGTHSVKDTLTAVTGAVVPFHHAVLDEGGVKNLVLGYAHFGMVAAARWIVQLAVPHLRKAQSDYPSYKLKVVGHSLGGGTAALLTFILREREEFQSAFCVCFGPAACMTWDLAESGGSFITTVINGSDIVPTFSVASADDLRAEFLGGFIRTGGLIRKFVGLKVLPWLDGEEIFFVELQNLAIEVTASAWINDFREQIEHTRILSTVFRSASALGNRLSSIASMSRNRNRDGQGGAIWRPVTNSTQVVMRKAQDVAQAVARTRPSLASWSCMGARPRSGASGLVSTVDGTASSSSPTVELIIADEGDVAGEISPSRGNHTASNSDVDGLPESFNVTYGVDQEQSQQEAESWVRQTLEQTEGDFPLLPGDRIFKTEEEFRKDLDVEDDDVDLPQTSESDDMGEAYLWRHLEQELKRQSEDGRLAREEEEAAAMEITREEESIVSSAAEAGQDIVGSSEDLDSQESITRFYPPGRVMHIVCPVSEDGEASASDGEQSPRSRVGIFLTDRKLYGKVRLSRTMVHDHYMPTYKRMMEALIRDLEKEANPEAEDNRGQNEIESEDRDEAHGP